jgi:hypothetical protein
MEVRFHARSLDEKGAGEKLIRYKQGQKGYENNLESLPDQKI